MLQILLAARKEIRATTPGRDDKGPVHLWDLLLPALLDGSLQAGFTVTCKFSNFQFSQWAERLKVILMGCYVQIDLEKYGLHEQLQLLIKCIESAALSLFKRLPA